MPSIPALRLPQLDGLDGKILSQLYVDGVLLTDILALYELNASALYGPKKKTLNQFWASKERYSTSEQREVLEITLGSNRRVNRFSFQVSKFPFRAWLQYYDDASSSWKSVKDQHGNEIEINNRDSVPKRLHPHVTTDQHRHPQHRVAGHWRHVSLRTKRVMAQRFRLVFVRVPNLNAPRAIGSGKEIAYSLAVKDFTLGYQVANEADVPRPLVRTSSASESETFSSSVDLLGSPINFSLVKYDAADLLWPTLEKINGVAIPNSPTRAKVWKCEPQPISNAVVNLYVDARDSQGAAQYVDRFYIDPLTSGVPFNLYYSSDDIPSEIDFTASDEHIRFPAVQTAGTVSLTADGYTFPNAIGYVDISNAVVQVPDIEPWWVGIKFNPSFDSTDTNEFVIFESKNVSVRWNNGQWIVKVNGVTDIFGTSAFAINQSLGIVVGWNNGTSVVHLWDGQTAENTDVNAAAVGNFTQAAIDSAPILGSALRFGGALVDSLGDPLHGNYRLSGAVIKLESLSPATATEFFSTSADAYLIKPDFDSDAADFTTNALLRFHPYFAQTAVNALTGFVGGSAVPYESMVWTLVRRDFALRKGYVVFDPVMAKHFKFEFSGLKAEPYEAWEEESRTVHVFTQEAIDASSISRLPGPTRQTIAGEQMQQTLGSQLRFRDESRLITKTAPNRGYDEYTPTEAFYSANPATTDRLVSSNPAFAMQQWRSGYLPKNGSVSRHVYETIQVMPKYKIAYFVGLAEIRMYRRDYFAQNDEGEYFFPFYDMGAVDLASSPSPWTLVDGYGLTTPHGFMSGAVASVSKTVLSQRKVRGLQFASTQTQPLQVLPDADFDSGNLNDWSAIGSAVISLSQDYQSTIGSTVKVERQGGVGYWLYLEALYATWADMQVDPLGNTLTWADIEASESSDLSLGAWGGIKSLVYTNAPAVGRVYAAARVYTDVALSASLRLEIIGYNDEVLASSEITPHAGTITEWYVGYTPNTAIDYSGYRLWSDVETVGTWGAVELLGSWADVSNSYGTRYEGPLSVRLIQTAPSFDSFYVDNISYFEDPILWSFSNDDGVTWVPAYDIRNNPNGVLTFSENVGAPIGVGDGISLRWKVEGGRPALNVNALYIRPWYASLDAGVPPRTEMEQHGPNLTPYDQYSEIVDAPPWKAWDSPIPEEWYYAFRQRVQFLGFSAPVPTVPPPVVSSRTIVINL